MADGHLGKCKNCTKSDTAKRHERLSKNPKWMATERARHRLKQARYRANGTACKATQKARDKWAKRNEHKIMAHKLADNAVRKGLIIRPDACNRCGAKATRLEKHHEDYSKPLAIEWLCPACHGATRRKDDFDLIP